MDNITKNSKMLSESIKCNRIFFNNYFIFGNFVWGAELSLLDLFLYIGSCLNVDTFSVVSITL